MTKKCYCTHEYIINTDKIDAYFRLGSSEVFTSKLDKIEGLECTDGTKITIISRCEIEDFLCINEANRFARYDCIIIEDILTFFSGNPITIYESQRTSDQVGIIKYMEMDNYLNINGIDYTSDLIKLLSSLEEEGPLLSSVLNKWKRGLYLQEKSDDGDLLFNEAFLSFFHILEILGQSITDELKEKQIGSIDNFLNNYFKTFFLSNNELTQKINENRKTLQKILFDNNFNLAFKIKYFIDKYGLFDERISFLVDNLIKTRNLIAHGNNFYSKSFTWPLPAFLPPNTGAQDNINLIIYFTARLLSLYMDLDCWKNEWDECMKNLPPTQDVIIKFLNNEIILKDDDSLTEGNEYHLCWDDIFDYYVQHPQKTLLNKISKISERFFLHEEINERNASDIYNISIILADSNIIPIQQKAQENIKIIIQNGWYPWSSYKDVYTYLTEHSIAITWFKDYLSGKH